ncbi:hypothetical protein ACFWN7_15985 [Agromyces sp. NPDC058484]|uniref:hypothetical protein n=1 Tax=Agromyces sp. NPDC058484 TaxID=3346524 RepID=UPI00365ED527
MVTETPFVRDLITTGAVFGLACFIWSGWAQERPPKRWPVVLGILSGLGVLAAVGFGIAAWLNWDAPSVLGADSGGMGPYLVILAIEVGACVVGAIALSVKKATRPYVAVLVLFIVGVHFFSLAAVFQMPAMHVVAALTTLASIAALVLSLRLRGRADTPAPSFWCGILAAPILLVASVAIGLSGLVQVGR